MGISSVGGVLTFREYMCPVESATPPMSASWMWPSVPTITFWGFKSLVHVFTAGGGGRGRREEGKEGGRERRKESRKN